MLDVDQRAEADDVRDEYPAPDTDLVLTADPTLDRPLPLGRVGEALAWAGVLLTALILRLASLGTDALTADGARHAFAAYSLFRGSGTALDSAVGGPFATLFGALCLFLFGVSDQIVRLGPALAGIGTVALVIALRPYLGRAGALLAGLLLAVSPSLVYFSRLEESYIYATFFALLLFVALLRTFDHGRRGDFVLAAAAGALLFVSAPIGPTLLLIFVVATVAIWHARAEGRHRCRGRRRGRRAAIRRGGTRGSDARRRGPGAAAGCRAPAAHLQCLRGGAWQSRAWPG